MPIYEFRCKQCESAFERLFTSGHQQPVRCPGCGSPEVTQLFSVFGVGAANTTAEAPTETPMCGACGRHTPKPCA